MQYIICKKLSDDWISIH